ncbi:MAG TPA: hypothetical protein VF579_10125, partial [Candidatus Methylomirabilis sp.]
MASIKRMADKIFPAQPRSGPWTANEVMDLRRYLGATTPEVIAKILARSIDEVNSRIFELGRIKKDG